MDENAHSQCRISEDVLNALKSTYLDVACSSEEFKSTVCGVLSRPPLFTTLRVNTLHRETVGQIRDRVKAHVDERYAAHAFHVNFHAHIPDLLVVPSRCCGHENGAGCGPAAMITVLAECDVVVDAVCGAAVLRGADVFSVGVLAAPQSLRPGSICAVYADVDGGCKRGLTRPYDGARMCLGQGVSRVSRGDLFKHATEQLSGVAVEMTLPVVASPALSGVLPGAVFPQNLPSVVCAHVLGPRPRDLVLDLCAAPGGKTSHLAALMADQGLVVACDRTARKVGRIVATCARLGLTCVSAHVYDGTRVVSTDAGSAPAHGVAPPYIPETFHRVLVDAPCSALGQRPQIVNTSISSQIRSYPNLQQRLLRAAVSALRVAGTLVYSTCTLTLAENEAQVWWVLRTFPSLRLVSQRPHHIGGPGLRGSELSDGERGLVQRFDPVHAALLHTPATSCDTDTIGFFIAKFVKVQSSNPAT